MAIKQAKIITVTSVKGGSGKSTTVLNIAGILSEKNLKTVIVDMDLYSGMISAALNIESDNDIYTMVDDLGGSRFKQIENYVKPYNENIDIISAPKDPRNVLKIHPSYIDIIINRLRYKYDVILIDTNHIIDQINLVTFDLSDKIIYVLPNDLMAFKNMKTMISIYQDMGLDKYIVVLNDSLGYDHFSYYDIKSILGIDIKYVLPKSFYVKNIQKYVTNGKILTLEKNFTHSKGTLILKELVEDILK